MFSTFYQSHTKSSANCHLLRLLGQGRRVENLTSPFISSTAMMSFGPLLRTLLVLKHNKNKGDLEKLHNTISDFIHISFLNTFYEVYTLKNENVGTVSLVMHNQAVCFYSQIERNRTVVLFFLPIHTLFHSKGYVTALKCDVVPQDVNVVTDHFVMSLGISKLIYGYDIEVNTSEFLQV